MATEQDPPSRRAVSVSSAAGASRRRSTSAASSSATSQYDGPQDDQWRVGSAYDYVNPDLTSDWIKCAICLGPFYEPWAATSSCSHTFCQHCIRQHHRTLSRDNLGNGENEALPCPSCRTLNPLSGYRAAQPLIRNLVDSLQVYCPVKNRGCEWTGERESVVHHLAKDCGWTWVGEFDGDESIEDPSFGGAYVRRRKGNRCQCGARLMRKDWDNHCAKGCTVVWQRCEHCEAWVQSDKEQAFDEQQSHRESCTAAPVQCQHCTETLPRAGFQAHELEDCCSILVSCSMAQFGCHWKGPRGSLGLPQGVSGPLEPHCHNVTCAFVPLASYLQASSQRLHLLEGENASLRRDLIRSNAAVEANSELLRSCVDTLGMWCQRSSDDDHRARRSTPDFHPARRLSGRSGVDNPEDYLAAWPFMAESDDPSSLEAQRAAEAASLQPAPSTAHQCSRPSRFEHTINDLMNSVSALSTQDATLTNLLHDSRRESIYASVEVARLAEEVANLRHGLHNVARQLQMRQTGWRGGSAGAGLGPGSGSVGSEEGKVPSAPLTSSSAPNQKSSVDNGLESGMSSLFEQGRGPGMGMGNLPFLPHGPVLPHSPYHHPGYQPHGFPYPPPSLPMPMPGVRRFWSGFEQTKL